MNSILPPIAAVHPHSLTYHGDERIDPYYWLRDDTRSDPAVLDYLQAENGYTEAMLQPTEALQKELSLLINATLFFHLN
jgi:oligopeptidase B